jgi:hypothetical protein
MLGQGPSEQLIKQPEKRYACRVMTPVLLELQHGLIEAIGAHTQIQDGFASQSFEVRLPRLLPADFIAEDERVTIGLC